MDRKTKAVEKALYDAALSGNFQAICFWLCNRAPDEWSKNPEPPKDNSQGVLPQLLDYFISKPWAGDDSE